MNRIAFVCIVLICIPVVVFSQPPGGGPATPPDVPISGIEILIGAGAALGLRRFLSNKNRNKE